jgi:hypothetical protein
MSKSLDKIKLAHENFKCVQQKLSKYGATDTEPDETYQMAVREAISGHPFKPLTADGWQLYTCGMNCKMAAKRLNFALQKVANAIMCAPLKDQPEIIVWFATWAWRVTV